MNRANHIPQPRPTARLRILQTTDLHMQLLAHDYLTGRSDHTAGLVGLAGHIARLRAEPGVTTLLCDNGDLLQGNPLADYLATALGPADLHPMIAALNTLQYDAMTLGNHEFDYGIAFLRQMLQHADCAVVSANLTCPAAPTLARPFAILARNLLCDDGQTRPVKLGVTGFAPPQTALWHGGPGNAQIYATDIITAAEHILPDMMAQGADIIIALCHSGIGDPDHSPGMENAALALAGVPGIDMVLCGHTHGAFPDADRPASAGVDPVAGTLRGKPAVMAKAYGKALGVVDLKLAWADSGWHIAAHQARLEENDGQTTVTALQKRLMAPAAPAHAATLRHLDGSIARTDVPINSYLAAVQPELSQQLLAFAAQQAVMQALQDGPCHDLPVLAATSCYHTGGRNGSGHYIDIPPGPVTQRDAAAIFPFTDTLCAVRRNGAQIVQWLERSVSHYHRITPGLQDQPLVNPQSAPYNFDAIYGVRYQIDLTAPARFDTVGRLVAPDAWRIKNLMYRGKAVRDDDLFVVASNRFRTCGGGGFAMPDDADILLSTQRKLRDILIASLQTRRIVTRPAVPTWAFAAIPGSSAVFYSAADARAHLPDHITAVGPDQAGFHRYRITL